MSARAPAPSCRARLRASRRPPSSSVSLSASASSYGQPNAAQAGRPLPIAGELQRMRATRSGGSSSTMPCCPANTRYARSTPPSDGRVPGRTRVGLPLECRRDLLEPRDLGESAGDLAVSIQRKSGKDHRERLVQQRPCARVATSSPHEREYEQSNQPRLGRVSWLVDKQLRGRRRVVPAAELGLDDRSKLEQARRQRSSSSLSQTSRPSASRRSTKWYDRFSAAPIARLWSPRTT